MAAASGGSAPSHILTAAGTVSRLAMSVASSTMVDPTAGGGKRTLRLASAATYHRPHRDESRAPTRTVYEATIGAIDPAVATQRCVEARLATRLNDLVSDAVSRIPAATHDRLMAETEASLAAAAAAAATPAAAPPMSGSATLGGAGAAASRTVSPASTLARAGAATMAGTGSGASSGVGGDPALAAADAAAAEAQVPAFARLTAVLAAGKRHGIRGAMVREFFAATHAGGGPFVGSRSAQGEFMASTFYAHARPSGGFAVHRPSPYSSSGYRLHNFDKVG